MAEQLRNLLASEFDVVAVVPDGQALLRAAEAVHPDVVVTDIVMPALDGIAATAALLAKQPDVCVVLVTVQDEPRAGGARPSQRCSRLRRQAPRRPRAGARGKGSTAGRTLRVGIQAERQELRSCPEFSWPCGQAPAAGRVLSSRVRRNRWPDVLGTDFAGL